MNDVHAESNAPRHPGDGKDAGKICKWIYMVDSERFESDTSVLTGRQILERANRVPVEKFLLVLSGHGRPREIGLDETVDLSPNGVERLRALPRECREGLQGRRDFQLPPFDLAFLDDLGLPWSTVTENGVMRLVVFGFPVPRGYNCERVDLYLRIDPSYPDTQLDMVYVFPHLALASGRAIRALSHESFGGRDWQRWSRHRTDSSKWRPGIDNVESHLALVADWFGKEVDNDR